jgi:membrane-bound lytic murein transglycosylase F
MYRVKHLFFQGLQASAESVLKVPSCFAVNSSDSLQLKRLDAFITRVENRADIAFLKHFYFKIQLPLSMRRYRVPFAVNGQVSPFDASFKKNAKFFAIDWKLVAAIAFKESRFNPVAVGSGGAYGLMQFMPFVASKYKIDGKSTPDEQIRAGCRLVHNSYRAWNSIESEEQRIKFTLASYNAGQGHVLDAQRLAKKYGLNPQVWDDNVQLMVNNLSLAKYYKDPLVKSGPYHGHADQYANLVYQIYLSWKAI